MADNLEKRAQLAQSIAIGDFSKELVLLSDKDILGKSFKTMIDSLKIKAGAAEEISNGNLDIEIEINSENDRFGKSFQIMISSLKSVVDQASAIAEGDFNKEIVPKSDKDKLGNALQKMTRSLREMTLIREKDDWFKSGKNKLSEQMRGEMDILTLSRNIVVFLAKYLGAQIGCLYLYDEYTKQLRLTGSYAFNKRKDTNAIIEIGQGLVGQAAFEKELISVTNIPDDYTRINSAIGDSPPKNIVVAPILYEKHLKGIIEMGSFDIISDDKLNFFRQISENIAIAINSAQSREKMNALLNETQKQANKLERQQMVLEESNSELEEQTTLLKESEKNLKIQQKELQKANESLKEKTQFLEQQKNIIDQKNEALELTQKDLQIQAKELENASKYKSEFLANMSHELRTPLNSLLILAHVLKENKEGNLTQDQVENVSMIHSSGRDLLNLINDILDLSKVEAGKMVINIDTVCLKDIKNNMNMHFRYMAFDKNLDFNIHLSNDLPINIRSDQQRIEQIIKNLISNAIKFTARGGIVIDMHKPSSDITFKQKHLDPSHAIAISVIDTGIGIPIEKQTHVFEAFQQVDGSTSRQFAGTGLGLSISRELAKLLGGEIHLKSKPGKGSTFTLFLPFDSTQSNHPVPTLPNIASTPPEVTQNKESQLILDDRDHLNDNDNIILIIEDDDKFAKILLDQCHAKGFQGIVAATGEQGLEMTEKYMPNAIILDINLPGINGWKVLDILKNSTLLRHIPVHIMSVENESYNHLKTNAFTFLQKPVTIDQIDSVLKNIEFFQKRKIKKLMVVEDDNNLRMIIRNLIENDSIEIMDCASRYQVMNALKTDMFDCIVLDLKLSDIQGIDLLKELDQMEGVHIPPIIVYTSVDLSQEETLELQKYCKSIIVKGHRSEERLFDEIALFLHMIVNDLPEDKQRIIKKIHNKDHIFQNKSVLIVDNDMRNLFSLASALREKEINALKADSGQLSIDILKKESVDLVLMDIMMPDMDGYETIKKIRQINNLKDIPIIALTANAMTEDREKCIKAGASDYLAKPLDVDQLFSMMRIWFLGDS
ncbi:MAG: GAF sensor hybrid histidine kinase [Candidatus Magnetoglobus multicellularis str. Araruama]|uniref:histidine kinase n=1 Tax=Candidatus Magnetoglobus multicellularis str. Araruama TaxID=890399 RepID=A0A1V1PE59_9BACT|nr:MAG: GAF sensor hybrid histidine kinase [Candidatus Magnetoglobus multicellularis str. Araruama]